jgi:hypothetical protein
VPRYPNGGCMICAEARRQRIEPTCAAVGGAAKRYGRKCRVVTQACRIEHIANAKHPHARLHGASESLNALATADSSTERVQIGDKVIVPASPDSTKKPPRPLASSSDETTWAVLCSGIKLDPGNRWGGHKTDLPARRPSEK